MHRCTCMRSNTQQHPHTVVASLAACTSLTTLDLSGCHTVSTRSLTTLCTLTKLTSLCLDYVFLSLPRASSAVNLFSSWSQLTQLRMAHCRCVCEKGWGAVYSCGFFLCFFRVFSLLFACAFVCVFCVCFCVLHGKCLLYNNGGPSTTRCMYHPPLPHYPTPPTYPHPSHMPTTPSVPPHTHTQLRDPPISPTHTHRQLHDPTPLPLSHTGSCMTQPSQGPSRPSHTWPY